MIESAEKHQIKRVNGLPLMLYVFPSGKIFMFKIKFDHPLCFCMEVVETDDHIPSMKIEVKIDINQFQHAFSYQGSLWLDSAAFSGFVALLKDAPLDASLKDMSEQFLLHVRDCEGKRIFTCDFGKKDAGGAKQTMFTFLAEIDDDVFGKIKREFEEFPAWW